MIIDKQNQFSALQAVTVTAVSTDIIDTFITSGTNPNTLKDMGAGEDLWLLITVGTAATAAGAATVTFTLESDSAASLAVAPTVHFTSAAIPKASLTAGAAPVMIRVPSGLTYQEFVGVRYTVATGPLTAGTFNAQLVANVQNAANYAKNYTIS